MLITSGLANYPKETVLTPNLDWTPNKENWTNFVSGVNPTFISNIKISLQGQVDRLKEPYKTMNSWYSFNIKNI